MPTLREIAAELGIDESVLSAKADVVKKWDGIFAASESAAAEGQRKLTEAQQLDAVVNENIAKFGMTEANLAAKDASIAALTAALESVKKQGFTGINIPDIPSITPAAKDPMKDLENTILSGFQNVGQTLEVANRYQRTFGKPLPDSITGLGDEAARARMSIAQYAEQKYGFAKAEADAATAARAKQEAEWKAAGAKEWQESHPLTAGHPELNGGVPSQFSAMPKPRDTKSVREFAGLPARQKIADAMNRANEAAKSMSGAA